MRKLVMLQAAGRLNLWRAHGPWLHLRGAVKPSITLFLLDFSSAAPEVKECATFPRPRTLLHEDGRI